MNSKAIIWDMDGVISDTQNLHAEIESRLLAQYDVHLSAQEITRRYAGRRTAEFFEELLKEKGVSQFRISQLMDKKWEFAMYGLESVEPIPGSVELIRKAYERNIPQAVASSSRNNYVRSILYNLNVLHYFNPSVRNPWLSSQ